MKLVILGFVLCLILLNGCRRVDMRNQNGTLSQIKKISGEQWNNFAQKRIFFGHQSVGFNIVDGVNSICSNSINVKLNIKETKDARHFEEAVIAHNKIGVNKDPISKIEDFRSIMESGVGDKVDIKLCYVDIADSAQVGKIFNYYQDTISRLQSKYPHVLFLHVTVPVTSIPRGIVYSVKKFAGLQADTSLNNIPRNEYNELLRNKYGDSVIDLARYESTGPNGQKCFFAVSGKTYDALLPGYTYDGGHLNDLGKEVVGACFLLDLVNKSNNLRN